jgi:hypothetical protein
MMFRATACALIFSWGTILPQTPPPSVLEVEVENAVQYFEDTSDPSKLATDPNATTPTLPKNFFPALFMADIVAVNGQPAKGIFIRRARNISLSVNPNPGQAIADIVRNAVADGIFEFLKSDGTQVGSIVTYGGVNGPAPPGAPSDQTQGNFAIIGGTGAFLGARGEYGQSGQTVAARQASMTEDPSNRRRFGGGKIRYVLQVIPMTQPRVLAVAHSADNSEVTAARPAAAGESLSIVATGLGPCQSAGSTNPPASVNSPVSVSVNGNSANVDGALCLAGPLGGYRVNFQVPEGTASGPATLQLSAAWIPAPAVILTVQ